MWGHCPYSSPIIIPTIHPIIPTDGWEIWSSKLVGTGDRIYIQDCGLLRLSLSSLCCRSQRRYWMLSGACGYRKKGRGLDPEPTSSSSASTICTHSTTWSNHSICDGRAAKTIPIILYLWHFIGETVWGPKHTTEAHFLFFLLLPKTLKNSPGWTRHLEGRWGKKSLEIPGSDPDCPSSGGLQTMVHCPITMKNRSNIQITSQKRKKY